MQEITFLEALDFMKRNITVYIANECELLKVSLNDETTLIHYENTFLDLFEAKWFIED